MIDFEEFKFHPVVIMPNDYEIYDFSQGYDAARILKFPFGVGRYNEKRPQMYIGDQYQGEEPGEERCIHMGIDIGCPLGTEVYSFFTGEVFSFGYNSAPWDYGYTLVCKYLLQGKALYALYGHLSQDSVKDKVKGQKIQVGEVLGWVGDKTENGGWNPHLHFQLSFDEPETYDMPGVVAEKDLEQALKTYPDPRLVLGALY